MGKIYFIPELQKTVLQTLLETHEFTEAIKDINDINETIAYGTEDQARLLDIQLREKYPTIDRMIAVANSMPRSSGSLNDTLNADSYNAYSYKVNLDEDRWGIICDIALKKGIKENLIDLIVRVE